MGLLFYNFKIYGTLAMQKKIKSIENQYKRGKMKIKVQKKDLYNFSLPLIITLGFIYGIIKELKK